MEWPEEPLCKECEALCNDILKFDAFARPSMSSVHSTILALAVPEASLRPMYIGGHCKAVEWLDGIKSLRAKFGHEQAVYAFVDVLDDNLDVFGPSDGWTSWFGDAPAATCLLPDFVQLVDDGEVWMAVLQSWVNFTFGAGFDSETVVKLTDGYIKNSKGHMYKAAVFVSAPRFHSSCSKEDTQLVVKVHLRSLRRVKK
jgi:hypothetical protein